MTHDEEPLLNPAYGLDATRRIRNDDLLAIDALLHNLASQILKGPDRVSDRAVWLLASSVATASGSALPAYNFAPHEAQQHQPEWWRQKAYEIVFHAAEVLRVAL